MSFDLVLQPCRYDGTTEIVENPWTKEAHEVLRNAPLSADEVRAVREVLERSGARGPHEREVYVLDLADGGGAEIDASDLENGAMLSVRRSLTPMLVCCMYDLLVAGRWVISSMEDGGPGVAATADAFQGAPDGFYAGTIVVSSPQELGVVLRGGIVAWRAYRDRALAKPSGGG